MFNRRHSSTTYRLSTGVGALLIGAGLAATLLLSTTHVARATDATPPIIWLDSTNPASYPGSGLVWNDLSPSGFDGTLVNNTATITYDPATASLQFPGGPNGSAYVALSANMRSFTSGLSIEFEGEFGATRADWERIFDFSEGMDTDDPTATDNALWIGQFYGYNEMAIEVIVNGTFPGYCHTATGGTALGPPDDRSFNKWMITVGPSSGTTCRIFKNGVELPTRVFYWPMGSPNLSSTDANLTGSPYSLPPEVDRTSSFLGRSNFVADNDFEGSIRYIRLYNRVLSPSEVEDNASATVTFDANGGQGTMAPQTSVASAALTVNAFTRPAHEFLGWSLDRSATVATYTDGAIYPFSSDVTLYAVWKSDGSGAGADKELPDTGGSFHRSIPLVTAIVAGGIAMLFTTRRRMGTIR